MKYNIVFILFFLVSGTVSAQSIYLTKTGQVSFFSKTSLENIDAVNNEVSSILNTQTGELGFTLLVKSFHFQRALMEEHFNENYMESSKFPKAAFKGKINSNTPVDFTKNGVYTVTVDGDITIHGVTKKIAAPGTITIKDGKITATAAFKLKVKDYDIKVPSLVANKIAEIVDVRVNCLYEPKK